MTPENYFHLSLIVAVIAAEVYYWFWWFPKNAHRLQEAKDFDDAMKTLYGKDGVIWEQMRKGEV